MKNSLHHLEDAVVSFPARISGDSPASGVQVDHHESKKEAFIAGVPGS